MACRVSANPQRVKGQAAWRHKLGIKDDARLLLFLGRLQEVKQPFSCA